MLWPAIPALDVFLVIETSARGVTVTDFDAVLLVAFGSAVVAETDAESTAGPEAGAFMAIVSEGALPLAGIEVVDVQVMTDPESAPQLHPMPEPVAAVTPEGTVFETVIVPLVASGPLLKTLSTNDNAAPALTGLADAVLVIERSADATTVVKAGPMLLFAVFGSNSVAVTEALLEIVDSDDAVRVRLTLTV
jgi:hypothetical protein